ncbi:TRAP-type mannitol/chloroaromatic compound transport system permease small subunit [Breoghania corrubedonensis]|uniref:TRAP transporter small permease protein n=1 Tax=Breoghania corrubedonensis TaxID=665038 RepID=A0A2T5US79_9HYPH|nr:TRAP transporter small permease subunit [Breoghania corrubedonensis]PTW54346.1 TRAP-type mannitol/chloroaromatic compound transport system permease small subunit [Breoghania corrubedonensis]
MLPVARAVTQLNLWIGKWASLAIFAVFALLLTDVVLRYLVGRPAIWTAELAVLIFGVYAVISGGSLLARRGHVNVDIIYGSLSRRRKALLDILTWPLFFLFVTILLWQGWEIAADSVADFERSNSVWKAPLWPTKIFIPVAALLLLLQGVVRLWGDVRILLGLPVDEDTFGRQEPAAHVPEAHDNGTGATQ